MYLYIYWLGIYILYMKLEMHPPGASYLLHCLTLFQIVPYVPDCFTSVKTNIYIHTVYTISSYTYDHHKYGLKIYSLSPANSIRHCLQNGCKHGISLGSLPFRFSLQLLHTLRRLANVFSVVWASIMQNVL